MIYSDLELAEMQTEALFVHDANGRMVRVNEPEPEPVVTAPRFFMSRTAAGNLWRTRYDLPTELTAELGRLAADEPIVSEFSEPLRHLAEYEALLNDDAPARMEFHLSYWLPEAPPSDRALFLTAADGALLEAHFGWLAATVPIYAPVAATLAKGVVVVVCFCARITTRVAEAGVYTVEAYRGHGYATDAVRGWAAALRATGRLPLYSTASTNYASQSIARKLGAVQYALTYSMT